MKSTVSAPLIDIFAARMIPIPPGGERTSKFGWDSPGTGCSIVRSEYYSMQTAGPNGNCFCVNLPSGVYHYQITMWKDPAIDDVNYVNDYVQVGYGEDDAFKGDNIISDDINPWELGYDGKIAVETCSPSFPSGTIMVTTPSAFYHAESRRRGGKNNNLEA